MEFVTEAETTFDIYAVRYDYVVEGGLRVYFFNPTVLIHGPDGSAPAFHIDEPNGHYGTEYVNDPDSVPNASKTTFDGGSLRFLVGRDVYKDQDTDDKYLKFPDNTILGV